MKTLVVRGIQPGSTVGLFYASKKSPLKTIKVEQDVSGEFTVRLPFRFRDIFKRFPFVLRVRSLKWAPFECTVRRKSDEIVVTSEPDFVLADKRPAYFQRTLPRYL